MVFKIILYLTIFGVIALAISSDGLTIERCGWVDGIPSSGGIAVYDNEDSVYFIAGKHSTKVRKVNVHAGNHPVPEKVADFGVYYDGWGAGDSEGNVYYMGGWRDYPRTYPFTFKSIIKILPGNEDPITVADMNYERIGMTIVTVDDLVYIIGGSKEYFTMGYDVIETFNMTSGKMQDIIKLPLKQLRYGTAAYDGKHIYILGGTVSDDNGIFYGTTIFDPVTHKVQKVELPPQTFPPHAKNGALFINNKFLLFAGSTMAILDPITLTVSKMYVGGDGRVTYVPSENKIYRGDGLILCLQFPFECTGKPNGLYVNPDDCSKFFMCSNEIKHIMSCPDSLHFNPKLLLCDYPENAGCQAKL